MSKISDSAVDGILLIHKPLSFTSNAVLQQVKRLLAAEKAGHMGTLDPLATGMLPLCFGEATKFADSGLSADKAYVVTARFGMTTTTDDGEGDVVTTQDASQLSERTIKEAILSFLGESWQIPPMYSALKHQGKKLYELARVGMTVTRTPRPITIHRLALIAYNPPYAEFKVCCSKGTYIRSLIADIGHYCGVGAHVTVLHREYTAGFEGQAMYCPADLAQWSQAQRLACLLPVDYMLQSLPIVTVSDHLLGSLYQGQAVAVTADLATTTRVRLYDAAQRFQGLAIWDASSGLLHPKRLRALSLNYPKCKIKKLVDLKKVS